MSTRIIKVTIDDTKKNKLIRGMDVSVWQKLKILSVKLNLTIADLIKKMVIEYSAKIE